MLVFFDFFFMSFCFMKVVDEKRNIQISQTPFKPQIFLKNSFPVPKAVYSST